MPTTSTPYSSSHPDIGFVRYVYVYQRFCRGHFLLWEYIKDAVYMPPLAAAFLVLTGMTRAAAATFTLKLFKNMWTET